MDLPIPTRRPDLVLIDNMKKRICYLVYDVVPADNAG